MVFVTSWCVLQFALEKVLTGLLGWSWSQAPWIYTSFCDRLLTMSLYNERQQFGGNMNQNYYKWKTDGNLQVQAIPVMAGGGRSHLLSSIPNWDETQKEPLLREAPWNHRSWRWNHPILRPNSDHPVTLKELGSAFLITGCTSSGHLWPGIRFWTFWEAYPRDHLVKPRRPLPDGKANKHEEIMLFHGL